MVDQKDKSGAGKGRGKLPVKPPHVDIRDAARAVGERLGAVGRWFVKDPINTVLIVASIALAITFFVLLGEIQPSSSGERVPLSKVEKLAKQKEIQLATLLDNDSRVVVDTKEGFELYAAYPKSDAETSHLLSQLTAGGAVVEIDQQADKPSKQIMVQFLIPILLLVCLFVLFTRLGQDAGAGAFAGFS